MNTFLRLWQRRRTSRRSYGTRAAQFLGFCIAASGLALLLPSSPLSARAADPTFAEDVAPIIYKNCTVCHHIGGIGPFPLFEYDSAVAYKKEMKEKVSAGQMPPWHAVGPRGVFRNDRRLTDAERETILRWLDTGAKPGDLTKLPPRPVYTTEWTIGKPDVILSMPEEFNVPAHGTIDYQHIEVPTNFTEDKWVEAYEIMPGSRPSVHHVQVYARAPNGSGIGPMFIRNNTYEPPPDAKPTGIRALFAKRPPDRGVLMGSLAPGTSAITFPPGTAMLIKAGTMLTFVMHYTAHGHAAKDRTSIGFRFAKAPPRERIIASAFVNESFVLPPMEKDIKVPGEVENREAIRVWGLLPHTHLRGTRWLYKLQKPGEKPYTILDIPEYDFNWQTYYLWKEPLELPAHSKITSMAWYDNSPDNEDNPDPTKAVYFGEQTWDEMQYTGFLYSIVSKTAPKTKKP